MYCLFLESTSKSPSKTQSKAWGIVVDIRPQEEYPYKACVKKYYIIYKEFFTLRRLCLPLAFHSLPPNRSMDA